ncbi:MAG: HAD hydrolase-like protein [Lachnospiraceae bacterium]|nr:HAD hydrolase-like protein [Lachnospiraceae bacterium]
MYRYILFDLDGTLTDPKEGICRSVQHALKKSGIDEPDIEKLTPFIGPPLRDSFREFYHMENAQIEKAVADYRERFSEVGWKENIPYAGIDKMLAHCRQHGAVLAVASSKPQEFVEKILKHFGLYKYFDVIVGSEPDGRRSKKEEVVKETLDRLYAKYGKRVPEEERRTQTAMVGDRKFDIEGARSEGVDGIGVSYGYAEKGELARAGADAIAGNVAELEELLLGGNKNNAENQAQIKPVPENSFLKAIYMVTPFAAFLLLYALIDQIVYFLLETLVGISRAELKEMLKTATGEARESAVVIQTFVSAIINAGTVIGLCLVYKSWEPLQWKRPAVLDKSRGICRNLQIAGLGISLSLGLNIFLNDLARLLAPVFLQGEELENFMKRSGYEKATPLLPGILLFVLVTPLLEELIFRWLLLNRISRVFSARISVIITAAFFGWYHGNLLQGVYAFLMGLVMAALCMSEECVSAPYIFHLSANAVIFLCGFLPIDIQAVISKPYFSVVYIVIGLAFYKFLSKSGINICAKRQ